MNDQLSDGFILEIDEPDYKPVHHKIQLVAEGKVLYVLNGYYPDKNEPGIDGPGMKFEYERMLEMDLPLYKNCLAESRLSNYDFCHERIKYIRDIVRKINEKKEVWGIHIDNILAFYEATRIQLDEIINKLKPHHPEFEEYRLPDISEHDQESIRAVSRRALRNALENV